MTVRTRKGGVYDWDTPERRKFGPVRVSRRDGLSLPASTRGRDKDSEVRKRTVGMRACITAVPRWSRKGKREVRLGVGGQVIGYVKRDLSWVVYGPAADRSADIKGQAKTFGEALTAMANAL